MECSSGNFQTTFRLPFTILFLGNLETRQQPFAKTFFAVGNLISRLTGSVDGRCSFSVDGNAIYGRPTENSPPVLGQTWQSCFILLLLPKGREFGCLYRRSFVRNMKFFSTGTQENQYLRPAFVSFHNGRKSKQVKKKIHFVALTSF